MQVEQPGMATARELKFEVAAGQRRLVAVGVGAAAGAGGTAAAGGDSDAGWANAAGAPKATTRAAAAAVEPRASRQLVRNRAKGTRITTPIESA